MKKQKKVKTMEKQLKKSDKKYEKWSEKKLSTKEPHPHHLQDSQLFFEKLSTIEVHRTNR